MRNCVLKDRSIGKVESHFSNKCPRLSSVEEAGCGPRYVLLHDGEDSS